ncbi:hypothetical protein ACFL0W_04645 [Nanoarchaeota archaeon]
MLEYKSEDSMSGLQDFYNAVQQAEFLSRGKMVSGFVYDGNLVNSSSRNVSDNVGFSLQGDISENSKKTAWREEIASFSPNKHSPDDYLDIEAKIIVYGGHRDVGRSGIITPKQFEELGLSVLSVKGSAYDRFQDIDIGNHYTKIAESDGTTDMTGFVDIDFSFEQGEMSEEGILLPPDASYKIAGISNGYELQIETDPVIVNGGGVTKLSTKTKEIYTIETLPEFFAVINNFRRILEYITDVSAEKPRGPES